MTARPLLLALLLPVATAAGQSASWPTTHQQALWLITTLEHNVTGRTALWFDGNWRRMGAGAEPQQLLLRPGVVRAVAPGVKVGAGYTYVATAPYGELPAATPTREHRLWQDLRLSSGVGRVALSQRLRYEQRWIAPVSGGETGDFVYQQRARVMLRGQGPVATRTLRGQPVLWYVQDELFLPVFHDGAFARVAQNRFLVGAGLPLGPRQRLDVGYMNLWNALPARAANEVNHTVTINWVITSGR